jgi:hypothetical protein
LVAALVSCVDSSTRIKSRRFLAGLSCDELQFIAEYLGACILDSCDECFGSRAELAGRIARFQQARFQQALVTQAPVRSEDLEHKMILLLEYLCHSGRGEFFLPVRTW